MFARLRTIGMLALICSLTPLLYSCSLPGITFNPDEINANSSSAVAVQLVELNAMTTQQLHKEAQSSKANAPKLPRAVSGEYRVGAHDVLDIVIWGRPELNNPGGMTQTPESRGRKVRSDGTIFFPFVGVLKVSGDTVEQVRKKLVRGLRNYIKNPQIDVRLSIHRSGKYYVTGEVKEPGIHYLGSEPQTLLDAISNSGGMTESADLSTVVVTRASRQYEIDLEALYAYGNVSNNILLRNGDTVHVPDNSYKKVFVVGEVEKQTTVHLHKGRLTLAEALSAVEGINLEFADARGIYVLRAKSENNDELTAYKNIGSESGDLDNNKVYAYRLNVRSADALLVADQFFLQPRDVVFISTLPITRWNRVVTQILPTVQTIFQTDTVISRR